MALKGILMGVCGALKVPIDIGAAATDRAGAASGYTIIAAENPANASGTITSIEIWLDSNATNCQVATFYSTGTNQFSTRDTELIGAVTAGAKRTFTVSLTVQAGDYLGYYGDGSISRDTSGSGYWFANGDNIPCTDTRFTWAADRTLSLYGSGSS